MRRSSGSCPVVIWPNSRRAKNTLLYIIYYYLYLLSGSPGSSLVLNEKSVDIVYRAKRRGSTTGLQETIARGQKQFILNYRDYRLAMLEADYDLEKAEIEDMMQEVMK